MKQHFQISQFLNFPILLLLALATTTTAQTSHRTKSGLTIIDETLAPDGRAWSHGTMFHRFVVENPSDRRREVTIRIPNSSYGEGLASLSGSVIVEAHGRSVIELPRPAVSAGWGGASISEPGRETASIEVFAGNPQRMGAPLVLLSGSLSAEIMVKQFEKISERYVDSLSGYYSSSEKKMSPTRLTRDPALWPQNWLAYSPYDGVVVHTDDYTKMPDAARDALTRYTEAGGTLVIAGQGEFAVAKKGFGANITTASADMAAWDESTKQKLFNAFAATKKPWSVASTGYYGRRHSYHSENYNLDNLLSAIPTGGGTSVPVNTFFVLLFVFVVLAGPGAVIFLAKRNQRIRLLWIVPAFSLGFSAVIFAGIYFVEGFTPTMRRHAITLLDQTNRTAVTLGAVGVYAPSALRGGLEFESGTEVSPLLYDTIRGARIHSGAKQVYTGGWVPPRMSAFFHLRRSETRHERLMIEERDDGTIEVVNALGADIEQIQLYDGNLNLHTFGKIPANGKVVLNATGNKAKTETDQWFKALYVENAYDAKAGWNYKNVSDNLFRLQPGHPRTYAVKLATCPFIENPLPKRTTKGTEEAVVVGRY